MWRTSHSTEMHTISVIVQCISSMQLMAHASLMNASCKPHVSLVATDILQSSVLSVHAFKSAVHAGNVSLSYILFSHLAASLLKSSFSLLLNCGFFDCRVKKDWDSCCVFLFLSFDIRFILINSLPHCIHAQCLTSVVKLLAQALLALLILY